jgi:two-component system OmpR family sensor kinase
MWFRGSDSNPSLRRRLLATVLAAVAAGAVVQAAIAYASALRAADRLFDAQLQEIASRLASDPASAQYAPFEFSLEVWTPEGVTVFRSPGLRIPLQPLIGFSDAAVDGVRYRIYRLRTATRTVQVAQDLDARSSKAAALALQSAAPVAWLAPLLMLVLWLVVDRLLAPVDRLRAQVAARRAPELAPLEERGVPAELLALIREFNSLLERTGGLVESQQRFIGDAAHELRTPLAALKMQVQALARPGAAVEPVRLASLEQGVDRLIALAGQLLTLARVEAQGAGAREAVPLESVCAELASELLPLADEKAISLEFDVGEVVLHVDRAAFETLLRNLLQNALRYTPQGGSVRVDASSRREGGTVVSVHDSGPGIEQADRERLLRPFARGDAAAGQEGTGLGLAIAQRVARAHGAVLRLDRSDRLGGLAARVEFPPRHETPHP